MSDRGCRRLLKHLSDYLDKDLDPSLCLRIEAHMKGCKPCLTFIRTLKKTVGVLHRQKPAVPSARLKAELRRRLLPR